MSCLPDFAQPYRIVATATVEAFFAGRKSGRDILTWESVLQEYRRTFERWQPELAAHCGGAFGRAPPGEDARGFWRRVVGGCGGLAAATARLVHTMGMTLFGKYRCHQYGNLQA